MSVSWRLLLLLLLLLLLQLQSVRSIWFPWYFHRYGFGTQPNRHNPEAAKEKPTAAEETPPPPKANKTGTDVCPPGYRLKEKVTATCPPGYQLREKVGVGPGSRLCDDNPLVMQLARLYVVSPERIVLLLAQPQLMESCEEIADVVQHIRSATSNCYLADDNIYGKLSNGLKYYKSEVCDGGADSSGNRKRCASLNEAHSCLKELRTDMIECEAPADWYEKRNASRVCQTFNDVLDCYYIRGAMLCGLDAARQLRSFAGDSMKLAIIHACEINKRLPRVSNPMPIFTDSKSSISLSIVLFAISFLTLLM